MIKKRFILIITSLFGALYISLAGTYLVTKSVLAEDSNQDQLTKLSQEISQYEQQIQKLKSEASTLSNQIAQYDAQIRLAALKINQTEEKINLLGGRIGQLQTSLESLSKAFSSRVSYSYKMSRLHEPFLMLLTSKDLTTAFTSYEYLQRIQESDRNLLVRLQDAQVTYEEQKKDQVVLQKQLQDQKNVLGSQKVAKNVLLQQSRNDEKYYQRLLADARRQLDALKRFVVSQGGATILSNQTKCNSWGCYYNQRDSLWGNIGLGGSNYSTAEYGCLVNSVSMVASHYGKNIKPIDIAIDSTAFVPRTGFLLHSFSVNGVSVSITSASKDKLDGELAAGRPVIAGLYSGPDHFIVILRKEGDSYIMHDPFMENGAERPLTDKYSVSNISTLRLVSFN